MDRTVSFEQAQAILDLRPGASEALGREEIGRRLDKLAVEIADYLEILRSRRPGPGQSSRPNFADVKKEFATPAKTLSSSMKTRLKTRTDPREDMVVTVSHAGYVSACHCRPSRAAPRRQGPCGHETRDEDFVSRLFRWPPDPYAGCCSSRRAPGLQGKGLAAAGGGAERAGKR